MLLQFVITFISVLFQLLYWAIFIHVLMSWFASSKSHFGQMVDQVVLPVLKPFRWARIGMLDLSPILALFTLDFLGSQSQQLLMEMFM